MRRNPSRPAVVSEILEPRRLLAAYVVSTAGNDANPGTDALPWRTLQKAANTVLAGDSVGVRAGSYAGFNLTRDGTAAAPIVFSADAGVSITSPNTFTNRDGINLEGADYVTIQGFTVNGMNRAGIRSVTNHHVTIRNNNTDSNGTWGIFTGFTDDVLIENNVTTRSVAEHGIYVSNSAQRPVIRNNTSWGNAACGIHMNGDASLGGNGMITGALVEGNLIYSNGAARGGSAINGDGFTGGRIVNNLLYDNHAGGITLYRIDAASGPTNNVVANNTVLMASDARWAVNIRDAGTGNTLFNNVLLTNHPSRGSITISADSLPNFRSDHNVVVNRFTTNDGSTVQTLAQWRTNTGQDANSVVATPAQVFANVAANDYLLGAGSPAIDRGVATFNGKTAPTLDREGNARPSGASHDAGAYERVSVTAPAAPTSLSASRVAYRSASLQWTDNAGNESGFKIERKTGAGGTWAQVGVVGTDVTWFTDRTLSEGTTYVYRVRAAGNAGAPDSGYSNEVTVTTPRMTTPTSTQQMPGSSSDGFTPKSPRLRPIELVFLKR